MKLDASTTAFLSLDFQNGILQMVPGTDVVVAKAAQALDYARANKFKVIHVGIGFNKGHPEVPDHVSFARFKGGDAFTYGTASVGFPEAIVKPGELIIYKQGVSAFSDTSLEMILRAQGIKTLVLFGVATSGIVLSTLRRAFDLDFLSVVIKDACFDPDEEVHRVLCDKVFVKQAQVITVDSLNQAQ